MKKQGEKRSRREEGPKWNILIAPGDPGSNKSDTDEGA